MMPTLHKPASATLRNLGALLVAAVSFGVALRAASAPRVRVPALQEPATFKGQAQEDADHKSSGCISCHGTADEPTMHATKTVLLGCTDCHGGNAGPSITPGVAQDSADYTAAKEKAHVQPRDGGLKNRSARSERLYTRWLRESAEYVRFVNPGKLRVAPEPCS